jgi:hypothetical protein
VLGNIRRDSGNIQHDSGNIWRDSDDDVVVGVLVSTFLSENRADLCMRLA